MKPQTKTLQLLFIVSLFSCLMVNAQVGVGTSTPEGALDINGAYGGLVIPRTNISSFSDVTSVLNPKDGGSPVKGTVIYNLGASIGEGFYYYDGSKWQIMVTNDTDSNTSLGGTDQTLDGDRSVDMDYFDINFDIANNGTNAIKIDTDHLEFSRDAGNTADGLLSTRGGMAFNMDSNDNNSNDNEYFSWGQDGAPGAGTGDASYNELMRLDGTGLGVGTSSPETTLHVVETTSNVNVAKFQSPEFPMFAGFIIEDTGGNNTSRFAITPGNIANNGSTALTGVLPGNANGKNSVTFDVEGSTYDVYTFMEGVIRPGFNNLTSLGTPNHRFTNLYLVNSPNVSSDIRLKDHITPIDYGLETIMQITPVSYELISDAENKVHIGFKAQEIQEIVPELVVAAPETGMLSVAYTEMIPVLVKAVQDLNNKVDAMIAENANLRAENSALLARARE